jgi:hypothetical protein
MFDELTFHANRLNLLFEPERITSDFEKSLIKAVSNKVIKKTFYILNGNLFLISFQVLNTVDVTSTSANVSTERYKV